MVRKPVPPRIAPGRPQTAKMKQIAKEEKNPIKPQTFSSAQARELVILPPTFTSKNLKNKDKVDVSAMTTMKAKKLS